MIKRILSFLIILSIAASIIVFPSFAASLTTEEKALNLKKISIFSEDDTKFPLSQKLTRYEAAVYAARLMGAEKTIKENSEIYRKTNFTDVPEYMWYAPYIGYCTSKGIISGVGNNMFKPNDYVTEKAFLIILLGSLGYKSGIDFNWNTVFMTSYSAGLVKQISYIGKTQDNTNFTRRDAVEILYNALSTKLRGTDYTTIDMLIESGVVDIKTAIDAGLIDSDVYDIKIDEIVPLNSQMLLLRFNKIIAEINEANIKIYETSNKNNVLSTQVLSIDQNEITLSTPVLKKDTDYTIELREITDASGYTTDMISGTFKGYDQNGIKSEFFRISRVESVSSKEIKIYFTHPVNLNAEYPGYYTIYRNGSEFIKGSFENIIIDCLETGDGVSLKLKNSFFNPGVPYSLKIDGDLISAYGTKLNEGMGETLDFYGSSNPHDSDISDELEVEDIFAIDRKTLEVHFNKELDAFYAKQFLNYAVYDSSNRKISINDVVLIEEGTFKNRGIILALSGTFERRSKYDLYINFLTDTTKAYTISQKRIPFTANYSTDTNIEIVDVEALNSRLVSVVFNKHLVSAYATNPEYFTVLNRSGSTYCKPLHVIYEPLKYPISRVLLLLPPDKQLSDKYEYRIEVSRNIRYNINSTPSTNMTYKFDGSSLNYSAPEIVDAVIIGENTIKVSFNGNITETSPNLSVNNYTLEYNEGYYIIKKVPLSVTYIDAETLILRFDDIDFYKNYTLKWNKIADVFGLYDTSIMSGSGSISVRMGDK